MNLLYRYDGPFRVFIRQAGDWLPRRRRQEISPSRDTAGSNLSAYNVIGGGQLNCIDANGADTCHSVIAGGNNNFIVAGANCSSILGGQNNVVTHNYATVSGYGVTSVMDCAFHANSIVVQNIPVGSCPLGVLTPPSGYPTGTVWYYPDPVTPSVCQVYII